MVFESLGEDDLDWDGQLARLIFGPDVPPSQELAVRKLVAQLIRLEPLDVVSIGPVVGDVLISRLSPPAIRLLMAVLPAHVRSLVMDVREIEAAAAIMKRAAVLADVLSPERLDRLVEMLSRGVVSGAKRNLL